MKHNILRSIAHNIADSLASGPGLLIGIYETDIFGEAKKSQNGFITVDFLNATTTDGTPSLAKAVGLYRDALPNLCEKQDVLVTYFHKLTARYSVNAHGGQVIIEIEDKNGRSSIDEYIASSSKEYIGSPLKHIKVLDSAGRVRSKRQNLR